MTQKQEENQIKISAYLEITMEISGENRPAATKVCNDCRPPFLDTIPGALSGEFLIRQEDIQVLHGFDSVGHVQAYLSSKLFQNGVFVSLEPL